MQTSGKRTKQRPKSRVSSLEREQLNGNAAKHGRRIAIPAARQTKFRLAQASFPALILICQFAIFSLSIFDNEVALQAGRRRKRRIPRSFKELTPTQAFNPRAFFYEMVWKSLITRRQGSYQKPDYPNLREGRLALTWIGHTSFLVQFTNLNALINPNFANWLFWQKRVKKPACGSETCPSLTDLVLLTHAHFHRPTLRKFPPPESSWFRVGSWQSGARARLLSHHRTGMVGKLFPRRLDGDFYPGKTLGRPPIAR